MFKVRDALQSSVYFFFSIIMSSFIRTIFLLKILETVEGNFNLVILHTNDMHARYEEINRNGGPCDQKDIEEKQCYGGFPRLHYMVNQIKEEAEKEGRNVILVNSGDIYLGSNYHSAFIWEVASEMMNQLNFDIMCLGNHEFDDGAENLMPFLERVKFPIVCCNLNSSKDEVLHSSKNLFSSYIMNINGTDVGFIGYITLKTMTISRPGKVQILDEISSVKNEVEILKSKGVKIIIGLGHSGIDKDIEVVENIPELDVIIGGHSHTLLYTGVPPEEFKDRVYGIYPHMASNDNGSTINVPIAHAFAYTRFLGKLNLTFDDEGNLKEISGNAIPLDADVDEDESTKILLQKWKDKLIEMEKEPIGETQVYLNGNMTTCRSRECNMGNLITDAFVDYNNMNGFKNTGIAIYPAGGIRFEINATANNGIITTGDLMRVLPFRDKVYQTELQGKYFREVLEHSVSCFGNRSRHAEFLQFAGVKVVYNLSMPVGERVISALVQPQYLGEYEEINDDTIYTIILPDCLSLGSDGYTMFPEHSVTHREIGNSVYELVKDYINRTSPITTENSERIVIIE